MNTLFDFSERDIQLAGVPVGAVETAHADETIPEWLKEEARDSFEGKDRPTNGTRWAEFVAGRTLAHKMITQFCSVDIDSFRILRSKVAEEKNAPIVTGIARCPCISISHSKQLVFVAVAHQPIGIDIELVAQKRMKAIERALSSEEQLQLLSSEVDPLRVAFTYWTAKEAVAKTLRRGLTIDFKKVHIQGSKAQFEKNEFEINSREIFYNQQRYILSTSLCLQKRKSRFT